MAKPTLAKSTPKKGAPPLPTETRGNLSRPSSNGTVPLQIQVSAEVKRDYKAYAASNDTSMSDMFTRMWDYWKANQG